MRPECTPGQGLPAWTRANRRIEQTDVVPWHTIGMQQTALDLPKR